MEGASDRVQRVQSADWDVLTVCAKPSDNIYLYEKKIMIVETK